MKRYSRKQLALATISLLEKHSAKEVVAVLAEAIMQEKRTNDVEIIAQEIGKQFLLTKNHLDARVETARALTPQTREEIIDLLKQITSAKTVSAQCTVNPELVGGFKALTPIVEINASLARPLHQLKAKAQ
jgi:F0F1-type ATP synthase delta subunit